jgi:hypothetical protein
MMELSEQARRYEMSTQDEDRNEERRAGKNKPFVLRLPEALYEQLETWAAEDLRSVNSLIVMLLRDAVKQREEGYTEGQQNTQLLEAA